MSVFKIDKSKHDKKAVQAINVTCASIGTVPVYSNVFPTATAAVISRSGLGTLNSKDLQIILANPHFACIRAGFQSGTIVIEFQTLK